MINAAENIANAARLPGHRFGKKIRIWPTQINIKCKLMKDVYEDIIHGPTNTF